MKEELLERFLRYVKITTTSNPDNGDTPSSGGQWELARLLEGELCDMRVPSVTLTEHCYVVARIPASPGLEGAPGLGFLAHLDTSNSVPAGQVKPLVEKSADGRTIIKSDGTTLLGADDKAGIAAIMTVAAVLRGTLALDDSVQAPLVHPAIDLIFTPDEETGKGLPHFPMDALGPNPPAVCYTVDGGGLGEFECECFNAYSATVRCTGRVVHPGTARGVLVNAALMAAAYAAMLPRNESPEATDGYYGYYCLMEMRGNQEEALLDLIIRDFEDAGMKRRLAALEMFARAVEAQFPGGTVTVNTKESYRNMKEKIALVPAAMGNLQKAAEAAGVPFTLVPVRGGTDGARLTEMGIPTPNIFTGGYNFHSRDEYAVLEEMEACVRVLLALCDAKTCSSGT
jgi:tripeptide aminopeptidase